MIEFFTWLEATSLSVWLRESMIGFPLSLVMHALGMAFLVGVHFLLDLRILGVARNVPLLLIQRFFPLMWFSFFLALFSGLLLLLAYPAKGLTNPVFYSKLVLIALALFLGIVLARRTGTGSILSSNSRLLALLSLSLWAMVIMLGRLLAYTYKVLSSFELMF
jgi:hypothetical protein